MRVSRNPESKLSGAIPSSVTLERHSIRENITIITEQFMCFNAIPLPTFRSKDEQQGCLVSVSLNQTISFLECV